MITIVAVGKRHEDWVQVGVERYEKRLKQPFSVRWILLPHSSLEGTAARQEESERIGKKLNDEDYVILLDERGVQITSDQLSHDLQNLFAWGRRVVLVIGGAYGVTDELQRRADFVLSLSKLVLPHQLVRLVVVEQLYRAQQIAAGGKYHHA